MSHIALDFGGTRIKFGLVEGNRVIDRSYLEIQPGATLKDSLDQLLPLLSRVVTANNLKLDQLQGVSIAFAGIVDADTGKVVSTNGKYLDGPGFDFKHWFQMQLALPVVVENDARMALIGEWRFGAGRENDDLVMMTLGTGIGTAALIQGSLLRGKYGTAGNMGGHISVNATGRLCTCGNIGCAEAEASSVVLGELASNHENFATSALKKEPKIDYEAVFRLAREEDLCAKLLLQHSLQIWSTLVVNLIHAYEPNKVIIGGGISRSADMMIPAMQKYVDEHAWTPNRRVEVVPSLLGDDAALVAGSWLLKG